MEWTYGNETDTWKGCIEATNEAQRKAHRETEQRHNQMLRKRNKQHIQVDPQERYGTQLWEEWRGGPVMSYAEAAAAAASSASAAAITPAEEYSYWHGNWWREWE